MGGAMLRGRTLVVTAMCLAMASSGALASASEEPIAGFDVGASDPEVEEGPAVAHLHDRLERVMARTAPAPQVVTPQTYAFYPQGGVLDEDLFLHNYVDLDGSASVLDWNCGQRTYDGHQGYDSTIASFRVQDIGVPVFAVLDGVVVDVHDGEPDRNTVAAGQIGNHVILDHGGGQYTSYLHLQSGSIVPQLGESVLAGTQIALTGSSGNSSGPHLHFETTFSGRPVEPMPGPCNPGAGLWEEPVAYSATPILRSVTISSQDFGGRRGFPYDEAVPASMFARGTRTIHWRAHIASLPPASTWEIRLVDPEGTPSRPVSGDFGNPTLTGDGWYSWYYTHDLQEPGRWKVRVLVNGRKLVDAPFRVSNDAVAPNRPPHPIRVSIDAPGDSIQDVLVCRVGGALAPADPDYDLTFYRYDWRIGGTSVRTTTSAARSDLLPRATASATDTVTCIVTPSDGALDAPPATATYPSGAGSSVIARRISLSLRRHLIATGSIDGDEAAGGCVSGAPISIQRRREGSWRDVGRGVADDRGGYRLRLPDKPGMYRALAVAHGSSSIECLEAVSPATRHRH